MRRALLDCRTWCRDLFVTVGGLPRKHFGRVAVETCPATHKAESRDQAMSIRKKRTIGLHSPAIITAVSAVSHMCVPGSYPTTANMASRQKRYPRLLRFFTSHTRPAITRNATTGLRYDVCLLFGSQLEGLSGRGTSATSSCRTLHTRVLCNAALPGVFVVVDGYP